jgi:biopolymer transport protein ExbB
MRGYSNSKFRLLLLTLMLGAAMFVVSSSFGQTQTTSAPPAGAPATPGAKSTAPTNLTWVILGNTDPVFFVIVALSIWGLTLIIQGFMQNRETVLMPQETTNRIREMIEARQFRELLEFTESDRSFVSKAINPALKRAPVWQQMVEAMETAIGEQTAEQFRKIEYLNIIGNLGPLLGLLGTVLGMIAAFTAMNNAGGSASPADLAGGISKALAHTFLGLMLAVPCLAAFGILRTIVDRLTVRGGLVAEDLLLMMKPAEGAVRPSGVAAPMPVGAPAAAAPVRPAGQAAPATTPPPIRSRPAPSGT